MLPAVWPGVCTTCTGKVEGNDVAVFQLVSICVGGPFTFSITGAVSLAISLY